ncbi:MULTISPECIES: replication-relaxation family protein [Bacillus cereus group]|uniref:replication-relaxation family protein n=1 Tax=Bacillus cereus group TaxID=86661 RepID=UPI002447964C|nr:replication-relaxation family protein [Bacillus cytotoxicus]MDH2866264.1 replication-relaxation family protein [Bacillus cytotoxicus]
MKIRDRAILNDLQRFRCMSRDDIIDLHFQGIKNGVTCCNTVMKRLRRDGYVDVNVSQQPYIYFPQHNTIRKTSQKLSHFLGIVDIYKQLAYYEKPKIFEVEPKYGKNFMEPDAFAIWHRAPFFIEFQNSVYSNKVMEKKIGRYEMYFHSDEWKKQSWQPKNIKIFPSILLVTNKQYHISSENFRIFQIDSIINFYNQMQLNEPKRNIKIQVGSKVMSK